MKKNLRYSLFLGLFFASTLSQESFAGSCVITVTRTACDGKSKESYSKCNGNPTCPETVKKGSAEACASAALSACINNADRQQITKSKSITATYEGAPVEGGKNFCLSDRPDFNKCKN